VSLLTKKEIYFTWDRILSNVRSDLENQTETEIEIEEVLRGWKFLREFFRETGPELLIKNLGQSIINSAPWARIYIGRIGNMIKVISQRPDFELIRNRLLESDQFASALFEVEVAYLLAQKGIEYEYISTSTSPSADIEAIIGGKSVRIEIHRQTSSRNPYAGAFEMSGMDFHNIIHSSGISYAGTVFTYLSRNHWIEILKEMQKSIQLAKNEDKLVELAVNWITQPKALFAFTPKSKIEELKKWKDKHGLDQDVDMTFLGPEHDFGRRVNRYIAHKLKQIPDDVPGIIVIEGVNLHFSHKQNEKRPLAPARSWETLSRIEEFIYDKPKIAYLVLIGGSWRTDYLGDVYNFDSIWIGMREKSYHQVEETVVIRNKYSKHTEIPEVIEVFL
jgi:HJR/Mrr/RecB family endonuclease